MPSRSFAVRQRVVVVVAVLAATVTAGGCVHRVRVDGNVPEAQVRVDGVAVGRVGEGAAFAERFGVDPVYDVEVTAPGYRVERRRVTPSVVDPVLGLTAAAAVGGGCLGGGCVLPVLALTADDTTLALGLAASSAAALGLGIGGCVALFGGVERLPDVLDVPLRRDVGAVDGSDLPPPPVDSELPAPSPPVPGEATPPPSGATARAAAATVRW
ncbi:MAG: hypothetical protein FJ137_22800 [Deltaproteobacteria bacterium]|nr:hypothetical protein [Deltaproteobacteria bacterium]